MKYDRVIKTLKRMKGNGVFPEFIEYIRFPLYRNLEPNSKITFDFPLTSFVGKNGGGKSSTLQALYGCPLNYSLSEYWFSTALDPINDLKENRNCFIYGYKINGEISEVIKQRAARRNKLDYWEPAKPVKKYGMDTSKDRVSPVAKAVEYIDFRSELSAYDSFMYFLPFYSTKSIKSKQDYVRRYSNKIKSAFESNVEISHFGKIKSKPVVKLSDAEVKIISNILGKEYSTIELLYHSFLKNWGFSVRFTSPSIKYSEAFAGSGETAIIILIHKISNCRNNTILLLDEPETSLHPGAQYRLISYLLEQIKIKKLQVVISTHSPFLIEGMPPESIKVFSIKNNLFHVENSRMPQEAFFELEIESTRKTTIIVEDKLAKDIFEYVLNRLGEDVYDTFNVRYLPGGSDSLKQRFANYIENEDIPYLILDGDQKLLEEHIDLNLIPANEIDTFEKLDKLLITQTGAQIKFFVDGNNGIGNDGQKIDTIKKYIEFYKSNVHYLPKQIPEEMIWDDDLSMKKIADLCDGNINEVFNRIKTGNAKEWFVNLCNEVYGDLSALNTIHKEFIIFWFKKGEGEDLEYITSLINKFRINANS